MEIILAMLLGTLAGTLAGLVPGIHPNLFVSLIIAFFSGADPLMLATFLLCAGIANSFVSFIPSIFLGAPESETSLCTLPGHKLLLEGKGHEAVVLTVLGGVLSSLLALILLPPIFALAGFYDSLKALIPAVLLLVSGYMILTERKERIPHALFVFLCSGMMGLLLLDFDQIFPVFTGFFGLPLLFLSFVRGARIPERTDFRLEVKRNECLAGSVIGCVAGVFASLIPSLGATQASMIAQQMFGRKRDREFLVSIGGITTVDVIFSIFAIVLIGNPRSGIAHGIMEVLGMFDFRLAFFFLLVFLFSVFSSAYLTVKLSRRIALSISSIDYPKLSRNVFLMLLFLVFMLSGIGGVLTCLTAFFLGLFANVSGVKRSNLMGFLIIPTLFIYL